jgi:hypothetical protein
MERWDLQGEWNQLSSRLGRQVRWMADREAICSTESHPPGKDGAHGECV